MTRAAIHEFMIGTPTYEHRAFGGSVVRCTVPVEWPPTLVANGELFRFEVEGQRVRDRRPAVLYGSDSGSWLWYCDGQAFEGDEP